MGIRGIIFSLSLFLCFQTFAAKKAIPKKIPAQKTKTVKAAPLEKPLSSQLRERRQRVEIQTEEQMTQEIEKARIADEKARRAKLLRAQELQVYSNTEVESVGMNPSSQLSTAYGTKKTSSEGDYYVGVMGGILNYPQVANVNSANAAGGLSFGLALPANFWIEAGVLYSFQEAEIQSLLGSSTDDIDHIGASAAATYHWQLPWFSNSMTAVGGVAFTLTNRQYNGGDNSSSAFDTGIILGADYDLTKRVKLGFEYRYMTNLDYERDSGPSRLEVAQQQAVTGSKVENLENFDYQLIMVNTKITF